jgi:hypothetical protein
MYLVMLLVYAVASYATFGMKGLALLASASGVVAMLALGALHFIDAGNPVARRQFS